jgi:hypothetical protein
MLGNGLARCAIIGTGEDRGSGCLAQPLSVHQFGAYLMTSAVRVSAMALRLLWIINLALGVYVAFVVATPGAWVNIHMLTGIVIVILIMFLGIAQALVKGGSLMLTGATFIVGVALAVIGMAQPFATEIAALRILQGLHVLLVLAAIALGEICAIRYRKGLAASQAS